MVSLSSFNGRIKHSTNGDGHHVESKRDIVDRRLREAEQLATDALRTREAEDEASRELQRGDGPTNGDGHHEENPEKASEEPEAKTPLGQVLAGGSLEEAAVKAEQKGPAPDHLPDVRALARVLDHLQSDSPERRALLAAAGLEPGAISARLAKALANGLMALLQETRLPTWGSQTDREEGDTVPGLNTRRLSEYIPVEIQWAWPGRIPLGKLSLICGDPAVGKTWLLLYIISRMTTGEPFADGTRPPGGRSDCLFVTAEDGVADTIRQRVELLGGDLSRVHILEFVAEVSEGKPKRKAALELDRHLKELDDYLATYRDIRLVGLDPLAAFMGKVDSHRNTDVRGVLGPLAKVAESRGPAIVGINHLTKGEGSAMYRGIGSIAFNAAARVVWQVSTDKEKPNRSLFLPVKMNIGPRPTGLAYRLMSDGPSPQGLSWEKGDVKDTADEALNGPSQGKKDEAKDFLRDLLKDGPVPQKKIEELTRAEGLGWSTVKTAKRELGIGSNRVGGKKGEWHWSLPESPTAPSTS